MRSVFYGTLTVLLIAFLIIPYEFGKHAALVWKAFVMEAMR
jgi:hypothetical protein